MVNMMQFFSSHLPVLIHSINPKSLGELVKCSISDQFDLHRYENLLNPALSGHLYIHPLFGQYQTQYYLDFH